MKPKRHWRLCIFLLWMAGIQKYLCAGSEIFDTLKPPPPFFQLVRGCIFLEQAFQFKWAFELFALEVLPLKLRVFFSERCEVFLISFPNPSTSLSDHLISDRVSAKRNVSTPMSFAMVLSLELNEGIIKDIWYIIRVTDIPC